MPLPAWLFVSTSPLAMTIVMPCCVSILTELSIIAPHKRDMALSTKPRRAPILSLPREIIDQILSNITSSADMVCLALSHQVFLDIYYGSNWEHTESLLGDMSVRLRLDRDVPILYYCARCNCANVPCLLHDLENIKISTPSAAFRTARSHHNAYMGYLPNPGSEGVNDSILQWP
jgi:hypothetical protein